MLELYKLAQVQDMGKYWLVLGVVNSKSKNFINGLKLPLNNITAMKIEKAIAENKEVTIIKDFSDNEVMPADLNIVEKDEIDSLSFTKKIYRTKARQEVNHWQAIVTGLQMYDYININNILIDKGYAIHDDNKEETYLEILETGDEELIDKLEIYLNARDVISRASALEKVYQTFYEEVNDADSEEEVINAYTKIMETIYNSRFQKNEV